MRAVDQGGKYARTGLRRRVGSWPTMASSLRPSVQELPAQGRQNWRSRSILVLHARAAIDFVHVGYLGCSRECWTRIGSRRQAQEYNHDLAKTFRSACLQSVSPHFACIGDLKKMDGHGFASPYWTAMALQDPNIMRHRRLDCPIEPEDSLLATLGSKPQSAFLATSMMS